MKVYEKKQLLGLLQKHGIDPERTCAEEVQKALKELALERFDQYRPHAKQVLFHKAGASAKQRLFLAGNRTGKTYCGAMEVAMHLTGNYPDWWQGYRFDRPIDVWVASNTSETTKNILQDEHYIGKEGGAGGCIPCHLIERVTRKNGIAEAIDTAYIKHKNGGLSTLGFKSYDQGRTKFQGTKKHIIHFDEEPPYPVYAEALIRTMGVTDHRGMVMITMTPLMGFTDMVQQFMEGQPLEEVANDKFYLQATWDDNPHLTPEDKKTILSSLKPHERDAREKGKPTLGLGLVYPVNEDHIFIEPFEIPRHWPRVYGMDFGWSNPTAVLFAAHDRDNDVLYIYAEYANTELTPEQHGTHLLRMGCGWMPGVYDPAGRISAQKDGENLVKLYREAGLRYLSKAKNAKEEGIMKVLQRLQNGQLKIFNSCNKTRGEYTIYSRNEEGVPNKRNDHLMDALRYIVMSGLHVARPENAILQGSGYHQSIQSHQWMGG